MPHAHNESHDVIYHMTIRFATQFPIDGRLEPSLCLQLFEIFSPPKMLTDKLTSNHGPWWTTTAPGGGVIQTIFISQIHNYYYTCERVTRF